MPLTIAGIEVIQRRLQASSPTDASSEGPECTTEILAADHCRFPGARPLSVDIVFDQNTKIPLRDGVNLRADIFRPNNDDKVPALIAWGPYGKTGTSILSLNKMPGRAGVPLSAVSGYESFEGPDPAEWIPRGYAIVNIDARGVGYSQGDVRVHGSAEGQDGYDAIEHIASLPWCNGSIGMVGHSWLAMAQYHIAAQQPPHLKCIAPLEGISDIFNEAFCRGGISSANFFNLIVSMLKGSGSIEDAAAMMKAYPTSNAYWKDKRADFGKIQVPAYILASYTSGLHTAGSFRCYEEMKAPRWLTIHDSQALYDLYNTQRVQEVSRFFDRYLKNAVNDWEQTPQIRASLLGYNQPNISNLVLKNWPPSQARHQELFLSPGGLADATPTNEHDQTYQSDFRARQDATDSQELHFSHTFDKRSYLVGYSTVTLHVSCLDSDDLDVYVQLGKADAQGNPLQSQNIPLAALNKQGLPTDKIPAINILRYVGPTGQLRASTRPTSDDPGASTKAAKIPPGEIVKLTIPFLAAGMLFEQNERLVLKVSGHPMSFAESPLMWGAYQPANKGLHHVHFGGKYASSLRIPLLDEGQIAEHRDSSSEKISCTL
ncbi:Alpha/Beta hydrolase protein [Phaeosphaeria sp. MPI-PUGE-AT-0046c]|nr:Alpha/Beta hydrolase protein [Phaeosphaeria sp. MPI-PUGE-AT-0046c]